MHSLHKKSLEITLTVPLSIVTGPQLIQQASGREFFFKYVTLTLSNANLFQSKHDTWICVVYSYQEEKNPTLKLESFVFSMHSVLHTVTDNNMVLWIRKV